MRCYTATALGRLDGKCCTLQVICEFLGVLDISGRVLNIIRLVNCPEVIFSSSKRVMRATQLDVRLFLPIDFTVFRTEI